MSILTNATQALECGIEDYLSGTDARLKSAVRNVHAGILLLFKHKLAELSPPGTDEALIKERVLPEFSGSDIIWRGKGKKTVDIQSIKERFKSLGVMAQWGQSDNMLRDLDAITKIRNDIEHYYTAANEMAIQESISKAFVVAGSFANDVLGIELRDQISEENWKAFIEVKEVYEHEKKICRESYKNLDTHSSMVRKSLETTCCEGCGSDLLYINPDSSAKCRACDQDWGRGDLISIIVSEATWNDNYSSVKDGGEPATTTCPECGEETFLVEEMACALCGATQEGTCQRCDCCIPISELDGSGYCGWCSHMIERTMRDD